MISTFETRSTDIPSYRSIQGRMPLQNEISARFYQLKLGHVPTREQWYRVAAEAHSGGKGDILFILSVIPFSFIYFSVGTKGSGGDLCNLAG